VAKPTASNVKFEKVIEATSSVSIPNNAASKIVIEEDSFLIDIIRSKEMASTGYVGGILTHEIEISPIVVR